MYSDGSETVRRPDRVRVSRLADGTVIEAFPDGRYGQIDTSGVQLEFPSAGRFVITDRKGNSIEAFAGRTAVKQYVEPCRYRGQFRQNLIRLERTAERISPGLKASIRGLVEPAIDIRNSLIVNVLWIYTLQSPPVLCVIYP